MSRILVVDDSDVTRAVLSRILRGAGHEILEARDGIEGALVAFRERPDVVVTELALPTLDGFPLLRLLKSDPASAHIPVLVLTGQVGVAARFWSQRTGADAYLTKDHQPMELVETVERLVRQATPATTLPHGPALTALDVLGRVAHQQDKSLLQATLVNTLLERGMAAGDFDEAGRLVLETVGGVCDCRCLALAVAEWTPSRGRRSDDRAEEAMIHILVQEPLREEDLEELTGRMVESLDLAPGTPVEVEFSGHRGDGLPVDLETCVWLPLAVRGARAMLCLLPRNAQGLDAGSRALVEALAGHLALTIDNARLSQRLRELAILDDLTRVFNRRAILERLEVELEGARRYGHPVSIILCDLDHFKKINDTHGHLAGDTVLREAANALRRSLPLTSVLGRYGGEEFLAVLPTVDLDRARQAAERLRRAVDRHPVVLSTHQKARVTASFGVAASGEIAASGEVADRRRGRGARLSVDLLVSLADRRLYEAKAAGRNRVCP